MHFRPTTRDLEVAVHAFLILHRRDQAAWSTDTFGELTRSASAFDPAEMRAFQWRCGLVDRSTDDWCFSDEGREIVGQLTAQNWSGLGTVVLRSGVYDDELARLLEEGIVQDEQLRCPLARLRRIAPIAGAILAWSSEYRIDADLVVPLALLSDTLAVAAMEQASEVPSWVEDTQSVGWRAELYSWRRELGQVGAQGVLHVSRDSDAFGYDIERTASEPSRYIEVKGSRSARVVFVITAKELEVARAYPDRYEIQFWGEISLGRPAPEEYAMLLARGYPIIIDRPAEKIDAEDWLVEGQTWRVEATDQGLTQ